LNTCYVSNILIVDSESVISFFKKGKLISQGVPFFVILQEIRIYVMEIEVLGPVILTRKHKF